MIVVWGGIAMQILNGFSDEDDAFVEDVPFVTSEMIVTDTVNYKLSLRYEDPFKASSTSKLRVVNRNIPASNTSRSFSGSNKKMPKNKKLVWAMIKYSGLVKSSNHKTVGLLTVGSKSFLAKKGEIHNEVEVLEYSDEQILLNYKGQEKTIMK
ncbi:MAG: hypothetical protein ACI9DK_001069 [Vicingaceae bacterium]|jgi:hypothetical protein